MARWVTGAIGAHGDELFGHMGEHGGGYLILFRERDGGEGGRKKATVVGNFHSEPFLFLIFFFEIVTVMSHIVTTYGALFFFSFAPYNN